MGSMDYTARSTDPYINRFIQPDTLIPNPANPQSWNRYVYTLNNPVRYKDPSGHIPFPVIIFLIGTVFIFNGTSDSYQPNLSDEELSARGTSLAIGVSLWSANPIVEMAANAYDCMQGFCDPNLMLPGSAAAYTRSIDNVVDDLPRMTQKQIRELDDLATPDCPITICGGFAENAMGLKNRKYAETLNIEGDVYVNGELVIPEWRNRGYPAGRDVDYWTPPGSTFENDIESKLGKIFNTIDVDNYNNRWRNIPDGSVTFWGNGTYTRKPGRWQKYIEWGDYE